MTSIQVMMLIALSWNARNSIGLLLAVEVIDQDIRIEQRLHHSWRTLS